MKLAKLALLAAWVGLVLSGAAAHASTSVDGDADGAAITLAPTDDYTPSPWTTYDGYGRRTLGKLGFGVKNVTLGWTDLFLEPMEAKEDDPAYVGIGRGFVDLFANTLGGAVHILTFPVTAIDLPLPQGGTHVVD